MTLLAALHSHCMHLLTQAREQLPAEACLFRQSTSKHSSQDSAAASFGSMQLQPDKQQQLAWQLCCSQVQHDLLLVLQLTKHWQHHNQVAGLEHMLRGTRWVHCTTAVARRPESGCMLVWGSHYSIGGQKCQLAACGNGCQAILSRTL